MIRITIEYTASARYRLFRKRWLLILLALFCLAFDIVVAAGFSGYRTMPTWITMAIFSGLSLGVSVCDLSIYRKSSTPPGTPTFPYRGQSVGNTKGLPQHNPTSRSSEDVNDSVIVEVEAGGPSQAAQDGERMPFLPPAASTSASEKSDDMTGDDVEQAPFTPNKFITAVDLGLAIIFGALYVVNVVLESVNEGDWYSHARGGAYALKLHAIIATLVMMALHLHCFVLEYKALRKQKDDKKGASARRGVIRI